VTHHVALEAVRSSWAGSWPTWKPIRRLIPGRRGVTDGYPDLLGPAVTQARHPALGGEGGAEPAQGPESQRALLSGDRRVPGPTGRVGPGYGQRAASGPPPGAAGTPGERGYTATRAAAIPAKLNPRGGYAAQTITTHARMQAKRAGNPVSLCHSVTCGRRFSQDSRRSSAKSLRFKGLKQPGRSSRRRPPPCTPDTPPHLKSGFRVRRISDFRFFQFSDFRFCIQGVTRS